MIKAKYMPKHNNYFAQLGPCVGHIFTFTEASPVKGVRKFWPKDKNFPSSNPVAITDLEILEEEPTSK